MDFQRVLFASFQPPSRVASPDTNATAAAPAPPPQDARQWHAALPPSYCGDQADVEALQSILSNEAKKFHGSEIDLTSPRKSIGGFCGDMTDMEAVQAILSNEAKKVHGTNVDLTTPPSSPARKVQRNRE